MNTIIIEIINADAVKVFDAWADSNKLSVWFTTNAKSDFRVNGKYSNNDGDEGKFLEIISGKLIRFTWDNKQHCPGTEVTVEFAEKAPAKTEIKITHQKLPSQDHVNSMNEGWSWAVQSLKSYLETGVPVSYEDWKNNREIKS